MFHVLTVLDVYIGILEGKLTRFERGTWTEDEKGKKNFINCFRYLILEHLQWDQEKALLNVTDMELDFFRMWNLRTPLELFYKYNYKRAMKESFPEWDI